MTAADGAPPNDLLTRALRQLPGLPAPDTLLPRVMAAVHAWAMRPWYQRAWFTWPLGWQLATVGILLLLAVSAMSVLPSVDALRAAASARFSVRAETFAPQMGPQLEATWLAARVLWQGLQPILIVAFAIVAVMATMCLTVALALNRAVFGRT